MNIVITGASKGLGFAMAEKFAEDKQGHRLLLCSRTEEQLTASSKVLQARFRRANIVSKAADLGNKTEAMNFGKWILGFDEPVDILINNAGQFIPGSVHDEPDGALEKMIEVNLYSAYHLTRTLLPSMMKVKRGHIFNICSIASLTAYNNGGAYSISKFAMNGFTKNLREEMKPYNIKVTGVYPGAAMTDSWKSSGVSANRIMEASDIAEMIYSAAHLSQKACVEDIILRPQLGDL
ncbi:MAG: SDR family oxidoreductase [Ilyomonas sp.]